MIELLIHQGPLKGGQCFRESELKKTVRLIEKEVGFRGEGTISIAAISEREIRRLNREYRGKDKVTDVLSFLLTVPKERPLEGELLLSFDQAVRQAHRMRHGVREEMLFLFVHGVLHLFGFDHETPSDKKRMFTHQTRVLKQLAINPRVDFPD